jgi:DNA-binding transcriptional regulator YdaS (Cro superfamily)
VSEHQEIRRHLVVLRKDQKWLAKQLKLSESTVRQYLQPSGKRTPELMEEIHRVIALEAARQKEIRPDVPPWNQIFETDEQFDRADVASRAAGAESFKAFCRDAILAKADEILERKRRGAFPKMKPLPGSKVAEE